MLNELERPSLTVDLSLDLPKVPKLEHQLGKVEEFSIKLNEFYMNLLDNDQLSVKEIKGERTKVRKLMKTIADNRKAAVKAFKEPISDFEETSKRIEKILKATDDRMKEIVDASKVEDPFEGISVNDVSCETYTIQIKCSKEDYEDIINYIKKKGIEI